ARGERVPASTAGVRGALTKARELQGRGRQPPVPRETLYAQQLDLLAERSGLQVDIDELNKQLGRLVGVDLCPGHARIWPVVQFAAPQVHPDGEAAVAEGLSGRAVLAVMNLPIQKLDAKTLPLIRTQPH